MSLQEVADACGLALRTIEREVAEGRLISFLVRGSRRVLREDFTAYLLAQRDAAVERQRTQIQAVRKPRKAAAQVSRTPRRRSATKRTTARPPRPGGLLGGKGLADLLI